MKSKEFKYKVLSKSEQVYLLVFRYLKNEEEAKDAVQEIMIKLWEKRKQLNQHPNIGGFVFLTARNYCLDLLKKTNKTILTPEFYTNKLDTEERLDYLEQKEIPHLVENLLEKLPQQQREILQFRDLDGMEFNEISELTNLSIEHIRVILSRARKNLKSQLEKIYSYETKSI